MNERPALLLDPANPYDYDPGELEQLARDLEAEVPGLSAVPIRRPEVGAGGPLMEVLHVWLDLNRFAGENPLDVAAAGWIIGQLRKRWLRDREAHPPPERPRPRVFNLYNENDELVQSVVIDMPDGEPVEEAVEPGNTAPHPRPRREWRPDDPDLLEDHQRAANERPP
jgi:hypothetical protein